MWYDPETGKLMPDESESPVVGEITYEQFVQAVKELAYERAQRRLKGLPDDFPGV